MRYTSLLTIAAMTLAACLAIEAAAQEARPDIPFGDRMDQSLKDPDNPTKVFRVDFARLEHEKPLTAADRAKLTPENLRALSQEEIDQVYARLTAGPIPNGFLRGDLFFRRADENNRADDPRTRLGDIVGGFAGAIADRKIVDIEDLGKKIWLGKWFYRDKHLLRNVIEDHILLRPLIDRPRTVDTVRVPRKGRLGRLLRMTEAWLLFPAKLYCGQSLLDGRRESIVIDYAYTDEIPVYRAEPDNLAGRGGLKIRDEIRMVRPGFYLGRAYANRVFLLNFTLYDPETAENGLKAFEKGDAIAEDCWPGEQTAAR